MCNKKRINSHPNLETLPLDDLYNSNIMEYKAFYENLFSDFFDKYPNFSYNFGIISYDVAFGRWAYSASSPDTEFILFTGEMPYVENEPNRDFDIGFLSKKEIDKLLEKSEKEGINYLYEKVKDHEYKPYYDPDCVY